MKRRCTGFTLAELLIALALSTLLLSGLLKLHGAAQQSYRTAESAAELEERAAFALRALTDDIRLAGFWGLHNDGAAIVVPAGTRVRCGGNDVSAWVLELGEPVAAANTATVIPCPGATGAIPGTDVLILRHASPTPSLPTSGRIQVHTGLTNGIVFADGVLPPGVPGIAQTHDVEVHAWFIDQRSSETGLPALRRYALAANTLLQNQEIMPGIEDLQVELGIDQNADGFVDTFREPQQGGAGTILAVRLRLRAGAATAHPGAARQQIDIERTVFLRNASS